MEPEWLAFLREHAPHLHEAAMNENTETARVKMLEEANAGWRDHCAKVELARDNALMRAEYLALYRSGNWFLLPNGNTARIGAREISDAGWRGAAMYVMDLETRGPDGMTSLGLLISAPPHLVEQALRDGRLMGEAEALRLERNRAAAKETA